MTAALDPNPLARCLAELASGSSLALIREAQTELSNGEIGNLTPEQKDVWAKLASPHRRLEWSEGRRCENEIRAKLGAKAKTSLSHTRKDEVPVIFAVGAAAAEGLGVDVELSTRTIPEAAARKFIRPEENSFELTPLQIWVIKEALFKANPSNAGTVLPHYRIISFEQDAGVAKIDALEIRFRLVEFSGWVVSVAAI